MTPASASAAPTTTEFTEEQDRTIGGLGSCMKLASIALILTALALIVLGIVEIIRGSIGTGLLHLIEGGLTKVLGLMLLTASDSVGYIVSTKGRDKVHLLNAVGDLSNYLRLLTIVGGAFAVILAIVWFVG